MNRLLVSSRRSLMTLKYIPQQWVKLPEAEQAFISDALALKQKQPWSELSLEEKRAIYFIAYGNYNSRTPENPANKYRVFGYVTLTVLLAIGCWSYWLSNVVPKVHTQEPDWVAAQNERAREIGQNPHNSKIYRG